MGLRQMVPLWMAGLLASASAVSITMWVEKFGQSGCSDIGGAPEWDMKFEIGDSGNRTSYPSCSYPCTRWSRSYWGYYKTGNWCERNVDPGATQVWVYFKGEEDDKGGNDCDHYRSWSSEDDCMREKTCDFNLPTTPWSTLSFECRDYDAHVRIRVFRPSQAPTPSPTVSPTSSDPTSRPTTS
eukprot:Hpha_TRINITY_DN16073_c2_g10::TRINITY_DN16073_c2_g10_i1::g.122220::m.122220